jgi:hypothetical protein
MKRSAQNCQSSFLFIAQPTAPRSFSSSQFLHAVKKKTKIPPPPKIQPPKATQQKPKLSEAIKPTEPANNDYIPHAYAKKLSELPEPTLLYEAPSHTTLRTVSYISTAFFISYGAYCGFTYLEPHPEAPKWVALTFGTGAFILFAMGGWLSTCPAGIIKTLKVIPKRIVLEKRLVGPQMAQRLPDLVLEAEIRKTLPLPFLPNRKFYLDPHDMQVPAALCPTLTPSQAAELKAFEQQMKATAQKQAEYNAKNKLASLGNRFSRWNYNVFQAVKRAWTREGFMVIRFVGLKGGREVSSAFKLDVIGGGYALDQGRAIDRLADVRRVK